MKARVIGTPFKPGNPGKQHGTQNKLTRTVKETVLSVFNDLQKDPKHSLRAFARKYPREFYLIASKLIPTELRAEVSVPEGIHITFEPAEGCKPIGFTPYETKES